MRAIFDSESFYSILREDKVPRGAAVLRRKTPRRFRAAAKGSQLAASGELSLVSTIGDKQIDDLVLVSSDLSQEMLVGAGTMNREGRTEVTVGRDMRDPDITEVD